MADTCYSRGKKIIIEARQKENGSWVCQFTIPDLKESEIDKYQGHLWEEYKTKQEAKMAAFEYSKKILGSSNLRRDTKLCSFRGIPDSKTLLRLNHNHKMIRDLKIFTIRPGESQITE